MSWSKMRAWLGLRWTGPVHEEDANVAVARLSLLKVTAEDPGVWVRREA